METLLAGCSASWLGASTAVRVCRWQSGHGAHAERTPPTGKEQHWQAELSAGGRPRQRWLAEAALLDEGQRRQTRDSACSL